MQCRTRFQLASNWPRKLAQVTRPINAIITASKPNRSECDRSPITTSYVSQFLMANQFWVYATHPQLMSVNEKTRWTSGSRRRDANDTRTLASVILQTSCVRTQVARGAAEFLVGVGAGWCFVSDRRQKNIRPKTNPPFWKIQFIKVTADLLNVKRRGDNVGAVERPHLLGLKGGTVTQCQLQNGRSTIPWIKLFTKYTTRTLLTF